ncbi:MAG: FtsW/RodA/SpoVE family cell cycle protein [Phycisphaerales bacterium]|nr:FtsW/RodA/SpoVE family cell cycle protein [Phycisphaerales bacterium]
MPDLRPGHVVALCVVALLTLGVVMVTSARMEVAPIELIPVGQAALPMDHGVGATMASVFLSRSALYMGLALVAMAAATLFAPVGWLAGLAERASTEPARGLRVLTLGATVLLLVVSMSFWPGLGRAVNGSSRWISLPIPGLRVISVQPSEIAKWGLIAIVACYAASRPLLMPTFRRGLIPGLLAAGLVAGGVAYEDLGTGVLIGLSACVVLMAGGAKAWHFLSFVPPAVAGFIGLVITNPYRVQRLTTFLDPYADPQGAGYHMIQSMAAVAGGQGAGRGLGYGLQKFGYLLEDHTDFLFAVICEELGVAGAALVIGLYAALVWAGLAIVRREQSPVLKLIGLGITATLGLQALINIAVVTGMAPTKGIALPLLSAGGTGWIVTAASLGVLIAIDRRALSEPQAQARGENRDRSLALPALSDPSLALPPVKDPSLALRALT